MDNHKRILLYGPLGRLHQGTTIVEFVKSSNVELIKHNASDEDVARAAWVSNYGFDARLKEPGKFRGLINFLYRERHHSPFEHASFTFFVDTPIFVAREFMRHRTWSYNEVSARYKEMEGRFYIPGDDRPIIQDGKIGGYTFLAGTEQQVARAQAVIAEASRTAYEEYQYIKNLGAANEVARMVLPVNTMTQFYATANPRNVMLFLTLRNELQALYEIRDVAEQIEEEFAKAMPITYDAYIREREKQEVLKKIFSKYTIEELDSILLEPKDELEGTV